MYRNCKTFVSENQFSALERLEIYNVVHYVLLQDGQTALIYAASNGKLDICKLLLEKEADVNLKDEVGCNCHVILKVSAIKRKEKSDKMMPSV